MLYKNVVVYSSRGFDSNASGQGPAPALESKGDDSPEEKLKLFEKKVTELIEESCLAASRNELQLVSTDICTLGLRSNEFIIYM